MNKQTIKIVFYAINGTGLGHITRLNNIAEEAVQICSAVGIEPHFNFLITTDAPAIASKFLTTKLPSKTMIRQLNLPVRKTTARIKAQVSNFIAMHSPDCLVLDTNPRGSYNEFSHIKSPTKSTVFIDRHRKPETITQIVKQTLKLYDRAIVPEQQTAGNPLELHPNSFFVDKIHGIKPEQSLTRKEARTVFGAKKNNPLIYLSSGGGGGSELSDQVTPSKIPVRFSLLS
ncbi:hypothetical protein MO867_03085 [Microbulbifer sp. OS29]|uniref:Uncharacterized protein n=1 Tax=Microbulbifer okhotskensis TaxID=2926617 RepID=A0A9X2J6B9_9GAMM|nr:hypothetical protein [Microbulbifer okhotskensis]MCO1333316.1 hypothetical protein [Microbulbifer okhotskensis]